MQNVTRAAIERYRGELVAPRSVRTLQGCLAVVERLGFLWGFTPGTGEIPALFPLLDTGDEAQRWEWAWGWKDQLALNRQCYYGPLVKRKPTLCSLAWFSLFYALSGNTGDLAEDLTRAREEGRVGDMARQVVAYLTEHGPTSTKRLQATLTDGSREMKKGLEAALHELDAALLIAKAGHEANRSLANIWDLLPHVFPGAVDAGAALSTRDAADRLVRHLLWVTPALQRRSVGALFPWGMHHVETVIARLEEAGELAACLVEGKPGLRRVDWDGDAGAR